MKIDEDILNIDKSICKNIEKFDPSDRGILSQNILSQLRNFVEHIALKEYGNGSDVENNWDNIKLAMAHVRRTGRLGFLAKFHNFLKISVSHYTPEEENSERLMLKYLEYLIRIKSHLKNTHGIEVLGNINKFPVNTDSSLQEYYKKIVEQMTNPKSARKVSSYNDRYYIQKIKPFFVNYEIYYEVTFTIANSKASKFDRVIAFTKLDISNNYAVRLSVIHDSIQILGKEMPIQIISKWEVSVRPCELNNFADIFGQHTKIQTQNLEYKNLMGVLSKTGLSLTEIVNFTDVDYQVVRSEITKNAEAIHFSKILDKCNHLIKNNRPGSNVLRYLLNSLNNKIVKHQRSYDSCAKLSNLHLDWGCIPFDEMPFNSSLRGHNPKILDVFNCIESKDREHELFARLIKNNTETRGCLYTDSKDIQDSVDIDVLISTYNNKLYYKHGHRKLEKFKGSIYINGYEKDTLDILKMLEKLSSSGVKNYQNSVTSWLKTSAYNIDCKDKQRILGEAFEHSKVALIYGSAGTGKTTLINHLSNFFNDKRKLYLANTNPAVDNMKRKVDAANCSFKTIAKFLSNYNSDTEFDLLIIDESSTVSNTDMLEILKKANFKLVVLVGDTFQIESIIFGNWFSAARSFVSEDAIFELTVPYRTSNKKLIDLWNKVRNIEDDVLEHIVKNGYSVTLDESIFENLVQDEIILCLNYDGLYGINNINRFLQSNNDNPPIQWGIQTYKVNDPILFNETDRFKPIIYNNLKGRIVDIVESGYQIQFDIEIDMAINELDATDYEFELIGNASNGNSIIRFVVSEYRSTDEDDDDSSDTIVPFQVAYAVSIHKAQGLEYNSVKIVITNETEEMITHNIFYTAITRAKESLKIYWSPETGNSILNNLEKMNNTKDVALLLSKLDP
jgi:energy-coupling factor transporter ATP-binding protein EcfA2